MSEINTTTRRHPRTLADAFPADRACAIEHHRAARAIVPPVLGFLAAIVAAVLIAIEAIGRLGL